jgi:hypothetical protein
LHKSFVLQFVLISLILVLSGLLDSAKTSGTAGSDQTTLSSGRSFLGTSGRVTNMLVISSSMGMLYGILSNSTNLRPTVTLDSVLVVSGTSLEKGLISTSTSSNNSDLSTNSRGNSLLSSRRKAKTGGSLIVIVGNNNSKGSGSTGESTTVTNLSLNIAHNGSLRHRGKRKNISYGKSSLLSAVNVLSGVHTLSSEHEFIVPLETVSVKELNLGNGCSSTRVVHDLLDDSTDVSVLLSIVDSAKLDGTLTGTRVRLEDGGFTLSLCL